MAIAELGIPRTEKGVLTPPIWCNKKNVRDLLNDKSYAPAFLDCNLTEISDEVRLDLGVQPLIEERKPYEIFRGDIEEGLDEALVLRNDYNPEIPVMKIHSTTPSADMYKVRTPWSMTIATWPSIDVGWAWANYVNPGLAEMSEDYLNWIESRDFARRFIEGERRENRLRAENVIHRGDGMLNEYIRSFGIMLDIPQSKFNHVIRPHYEHFLDHFFLDRPGLVASSAA